MKFPNTNLPQYKGELDPEQIAQGINAARRNARRLADDAKLLLSAKRFPTATSLAALSIEESGKVSVLRGIAFTPSERVQSEWKGYRSHRRKNSTWILPYLVANGARDLDSLRPATDPSLKHTALLDKVKQLGFYTDCLGNVNWSEPDKVIEEELAKFLVNIADQFAKSDAVTIKEIELWQEFMKPVYGAPLEQMKAALLQWYAAMEENGLWESDGISVNAFVNGKK